MKLRRIPDAWLSRPKEATSNQNGQQQKEKEAD